MVGVFATAMTRDLASGITGSGSEERRPLGRRLTRWATAPDDSCSSSVTTESVASAALVALGGRRSEIGTSSARALGARESNMVAAALGDTLAASVSASDEVEDDDEDERSDDELPPAPPMCEFDGEVGVDVDVDEVEVVECASGEVGSIEGVEESGVAMAAAAAAEAEAAAAAAVGGSGSETSSDGVVAVAVDGVLVVTTAAVVVVALDFGVAMAERDAPPESARDGHEELDVGAPMSTDMTLLRRLLLLERWRGERTFATSSLDLRIWPVSVSTTEMVIGGTGVPSVLLSLLSLPERRCLRLGLLAGEIPAILLLCRLRRGFLPSKAAGSISCSRSHAASSSSAAEALVPAPEVEARVRPVIAGAPPPPPPPLLRAAIVEEAAEAEELAVAVAALLSGGASSESDEAALRRWLSRMRLAMPVKSSSSSSSEASSMSVTYGRLMSSMVLSPDARSRMSCALMGESSTT